MLIDKKERPILFSAPMVRAILEGRKTQTRRIIKTEPKIVHALYADGTIETEQIFRNPDYKVRCPYGVSGDRLWVRETWNTSNQWRDYKPSDIPSGVPIYYAADYDKQGLIDCAPWRPSIFIPRWASRITLEVTKIRVQRLQAISDGDCEAEGVRPSVDGNGQDWRDDESGWRRTYRQLWQSINDPDSWDANPYVWIVEFEAVKQCS
jgi:hypothetical protein